MVGALSYGPIPKSESRNPKQTGNPKLEGPKQIDLLAFPPFYILVLGFVSDFEIRVSDSPRRRDCHF